MHHIRQIADIDVPAEPLNHGLQRIGTDPATGEGVYSVACIEPCGGHPGVELASGFLNERHQTLPETIKPYVFGADVYRSLRGNVNLRRVLEAAMGRTIPAGKRAGEDVLAEALLRTGGNNPSVKRAHPKMAAIEDGDIVDREDIYPMRWAGEISKR